MLTACEDEELDDILPASTHEGFAAPDDWRIDCGDVPGARYAGDLWSCLNNRTRRFLSGLWLCPADGDRRGHINLFLWKLGEKKLGVSDYESLCHEIGHAVDVFGGSRTWTAEQGIDLLTPTPVAADRERAATAFFEAADVYQDWMGYRRINEPVSLTELAARLRPDAALCLERYFRPEDQHVLYATAENC